MDKTNHFQELKIFEDENMNIICDDLFHKVKEITKEELIICGSISKVFSGEYLESYMPKDIDFVISKWAFRLLANQLVGLPKVVMIEKLPHKIILYTDVFVCIEIWFLGKKNEKMTKKYYKNKIPYLCQ